MSNVIRTALPWIVLACLPRTAIEAQTINNLNPSSTTAGGPAFTLTISGVGFNNNYGQPIVQWNQQPLSSTFSSSTQQILAQVPAGLILNPGVATIQVLIANSPSSNGYSLSNVVQFTINPSTSNSPFTLSVSSISLQFSLNSQAQTRQVQVGSKSGASIAFGAGASYPGTPPANWLSVSPTGGVTPATLNVTLNPARLRPGTYNGFITVSQSGGNSSPTSKERDAAGDAVLSVTLVLSDDSLSFTFLIGGPRPATKTLTVTALSATNARFFATAAVSVPVGRLWLSVSPTDANAPAELKVSVDPTGLAPGVFIGNLTLSPADATGSARQVPVTLTVVAAPNQTLTFTYRAGAANPAPQNVPLNSTGGAISLTAEAFSDENWLTVSPTSGTTPVTFNCSVNPAGLAPKTYSGLMFVTDTTSATVFVVQVTLTVTAGVSTTQIISHIADGARWKTTVILINLDSVPAPFTVNFWRDNGTAFPISLTGRGTLATVADTIPVGGSRTIETDGTASALATGWAEVVCAQAIGGTAIFRDQNLSQEAAVPLLFNAGARLRLPFDTGLNLALGVALANTSLTQDAVVTRTLRNGQGQVISTDSLPVVRHGHTSFVLTNPSSRPEDQRGVLEVSSSSGQIFALGIRGNNGAFTSIEALSAQDPRTKVISHIANGARWKTTIILVNTDSVPVQFTINFLKDDGTPFTVTLVDGRSLTQVVDAIPVGGSRTIETDGQASALSTGWAEVLSAQSIGGAAIFRDQTLRQEAAVPLLASGGTRLLLPFDKSLDLGVALANASASQDAGITRTLHNEQGQLINSDAVFLSRRAHTAFGLTSPSTRPEDQRGVVEFSSGVEFFSLGIRGNNGAFTSIRALSK